MVLAEYILGDKRLLVVVMLVVCIVHVTVGIYHNLLSM
jgi:hypothetical protein